MEVIISGESVQAYQGIQFLGDLVISPEGPVRAAALTQGAQRSEIAVTGTDIGDGFLLFASAPGTAFFTPVNGESAGILEYSEPVRLDHPEHGRIGIYGRIMRIERRS